MPSGTAVGDDRCRRNCTASAPNGLLGVRLAEGATVAFRTKLATNGAPTGKLYVPSIMRVGVVRGKGDVLMPNFFWTCLTNWPSK